MSECEDVKIGTCALREWVSRTRFCVNFHTVCHADVLTIYWWKYSWKLEALRKIETFARRGKILCPRYVEGKYSPVRWGQIIAHTLTANIRPYFEAQHLLFAYYLPFVVQHNIYAPVEAKCLSVKETRYSHIEGKCFSSFEEKHPCVDKKTLFSWRLRQSTIQPLAIRRPHSLNGHCRYTYTK